MTGSADYIAGLKRAAEIASRAVWKPHPDCVYGHEMAEGARSQAKMCVDAILAAIPAPAIPSADAPRVDERVERAAVPVLAYMMDWDMADLDRATMLDHARDYLKRNLRAEHCGDCTKVPATCARCVSEEAMKLTRLALTAAGLPEALADNARLKGELVRERADMDATMEGWEKLCASSDAADEQNLQLKARVGELEAALRPFAAYNMIVVGIAGRSSPEDWTDCDWVAGFMGPDQPEQRHFKAARAVLAPTPSKPDDASEGGDHA